jgi:hypothetical protein
MAGDIDSTQMIILIVQSKGRKDRYVILPKKCSHCCGNDGRSAQDTFVERWVESALRRRYGLPPFCYARQRRQTLVAKGPRSFINATLDKVFREEVHGEPMLKKSPTSVSCRVETVLVERDQGRSIYTDR